MKIGSIAADAKYNSVRISTICHYELLRNVVQMSNRYNYQLI
jgi:hypothetical protein